MVLPPSSVGKMTLRLYGALSYSQNRVRDLRRALMVETRGGVKQPSRKSCVRVKKLKKCAKLETS